MTVGPVPAAGGAGETTLEAAHRALLNDSSIQFVLPPYKAPEPPAWLQPLVEVLQFLAPAVPWLFWIGLALIAALILFWVLRDLMGVAIRWPWQRSVAAHDDTDAWRPDEAKARTLLSEAEALAARGDYEEAVHLLLRRSVEDISGRLPEFLLPSFTARDIAAAPSLPLRAREAFGSIARIAESGLFARRPVGEPGWREARAAYERFAFRDSWRAA